VRYADVTYPAFIGHAAPATIFLVLIAFQIRRDGLFRPHDAKILSWEKVFFAAAQWIWVFWGSAMAVWDKISGEFVDFRVTPKGEAVSKRLPVRVIAPYAVLAALALAPILLVDDVREAKGFYILGLINAAIYTALFMIIVLHHFREGKISVWSLGASEALQCTLALCLALLAGSALWMRGTESVAALSIGLEPLQVVDTQFIVSGAATGPPGTVRYFFDFEWNPDDNL
jgi:cellulose synthase (UDP-forming)